MGIINYLNRMLNPVVTYQKIAIAEKDEALVKLRASHDELRLTLERMQNNQIAADNLDLNYIDPDDLVQGSNFDAIVKQIPDGWFVFEMGQSPTTMLWYCQLVEFASLYTDPDDDQAVPDTKRVMSEDKKFATDALNECIYNIEIGSIINVG